MVKTISIQVHDYDSIGRYRIILDCNATIEEVRNWKEKARDSVKVDWNALPKDAAHIVYYAELLGQQNEIRFAGIYMYGQAYTKEDFDRLFRTRQSVGYVGAYHKLV